MTLISRAILLAVLKFLIFVVYFFIPTLSIVLVPQIRDFPVEQRKAFEAPEFTHIVSQ